MKITTSLLSILPLAGAKSLLTVEDIADEFFDDVKEEEYAMERPDVFANRAGGGVACHENGVVAGWCDEHLDPNLDCVIFPHFDSYGCSCIGDASLCPDDCIGGKAPLEKTHYGISCAGIPIDEPNYILKEHHAPNRCENNAVVSAWCDDYVNPHLECHLLEAEDEYKCHCSGRKANCPDECINGGELIEKTKDMVRCKGIPVDQPNYIIREE